MLFRSLFNFNAAPESEMSFDVSGFGFGIAIDPGSIRIVFAIDADGVIAGSSLPRAYASVRAGLEELLPDRFRREVGVAIHRLDCVGIGDDFSVPACAWHSNKDRPESRVRANA